MKLFYFYFLTQWQRFVVLFTFLFFTMPVYAVTYYMANDGNDGNPGTSESAAWQTLGRLNQALSDRLFQPGDSILFKRGSIFFGKVYSEKVKSTADNRSIFGAYGNPADHKPILSGMVPVNGWKNGRNNGVSVCQADVSGLLALVAPSNKFGNIAIEDIIAGKYERLPQYLFLDEIAQKLSRFPNEGFLFIDENTKKNGKTIRDTELATVPNLNQWKGGTFVGRTNNWTYTQSEIKSINASSLTAADQLVGGAGLALNNGYFLQGKLHALDFPGEWFLDEAKSLLYFVPPKGTRCPQLENRITVSVFKTGFIMNDYLTIRDLHLQGYSQAAIKVGHESQHGKLDGCTIFNSHQGISGSQNSHIEITNNTLRDLFSFGISFWPTTKTIIRGNTIENVGLYPGIEGRYVGIRIGSNEPKESEGIVISHNTVKNTGYVGIMLRVGDAKKEPNVIEKNVIDHTLMTLGDGGSIYLNNANGVVIRDNIITNAIGNKESWDQGVGHFEYTTYAFGIVAYGDNNKDNQIIHNTIINTDEGYHEDPGAKNTIIKDNVFYNNRVYQVKLSMDHEKKSGSLNYTVTDNVFYSVAPFQWVMRQNSNPDLNWNFGTFDRNYYCNPYSVDRYASAYVTQSANKAGALIWRWHRVNDGPKYSSLNMANYQILSKQDAHSKTDLEKWTVFRIGDKLYEVQENLSANYISNDTFDGDTTPWEISSGTATIEKKTGMEGKALKIKTDPNMYQTRLNNGEPIPFEKGEYYLFSFTIASEDVTEVEVNYHKRVSEFSTKDLDSKRFFTVGPQAQTYSYIFKVNELAEDMRMIFHALKETSTYWLDNVSLYKVSLKEAMEPTEKSKIFVNPTDNEAVTSLNGINYRDLDGNPVSGSITLAPFSSQILINVSGTAPINPTSPIVVKEDAYNGQILDGILYSLNSNGNLDYYQAGAWQSISLDDVGIGMPAEGFAGNITGLVYMVQGNNFLPPGSVVAANNLGRFYWYTPNDGWNASDIKQVDALFSVLTSTGETLYSLDGDQIVIFNLPGTGGELYSDPPPTPLKAIGFPSDEQVKIVSRNKNGTLFYLVTESNQVYIFNVQTGEWKML